MQRITSSLLCAGIFATALTAQAGPGMTDADPATAGHQSMAASTYFTSQAGTSTQPTLGDISGLFTVNGAQIIQVSTGKTGIAGLAAGEYHCCFTVTSLGSAYNPKGGQDVVMGKLTWNSGQPVFTPNTMANKMNTATGNDFGLMIDGKDGTRAACDSPSGIMWSVRVSNALAFPAPVVMSGQSATYVDPAPGHVDGVLGCFWVSGGTTISWAPVKETFSSGVLTAAALDTSKAIVMIQATDQPHSPTPNFSTTGDAQGLWFSRMLNSDSDEYYTGHLPNFSGGVLVFDNAAWSNNGGMCGSRFLAAYSAHYATLLEGRGSHMSCSTTVTVSSTATLELNLYSPVGTPAIFTSTLGLALGVTTPGAVPGILGQFGLNPSPILLVLGGPTGSNADERATVTFPATSSSLKGNTLHFQALTMPVAGASPAFTNTISPSFK